ncbi:hypothetical protein SAMN06297129_1168 [Pseudooceanicola antarcticus]|uniref:DUF2125 domain-containing protein n=1 Tax=Pseudooceanicola antarcticus TaxID=1247613 RepID=A0A285IHI7_9RHOB|nr:DUF2125 domain-containing protein [Pseudooceanicola antarcticus]PJE28973.1 DUF2125 domain-containing protein [Pseudooceanicola antarcticus]SNY47422.1 hypothetical protein SAMN06297129_1168 [Pseudooceanicola antarcticus]
MKRLTIVIAVLALLWSGYWFAGSSKLQDEVEGWMSARRAEGWQLDYASFGVKGFPNRFDLTWHNLAVADPDSGLAVELPDFGIFALSYKPNHVIAAWPETFALRTLSDRYQVQNEGMRASLVLKPNTALELQRAQFTLESLQLDGAGAPALVASGPLNMALAQDEGQAERYRLGLSAEAVQLPAGFVTRLAADRGLPRRIRALNLDAHVTFADPWDIRALQDARPQPRRIELHLARAEWGELMLQLSADLTVDETGMASGDVDVQARNWRQMLQMAVSLGAVDARLAETAERALSSMASIRGNPETLDLSVTLSDGQVWLGFIPLGPAPSFILR